MGYNSEQHLQAGIRRRSNPLIGDNGFTHPSKYFLSDYECADTKTMSDRISYLEQNLVFY